MTNDETNDGTYDETTWPFAQVECRYGGNDEYFPGVIVNVHVDGTYDVDYDDGDQVSTQLIPIL